MSPRFIDEEEIIKMIEKSGEPIFGHKLSAINTEKLEKWLGTFTTFDNIEIFKKIDAKGFSFRGKLIITLDERKPVLRVKSAYEDYYLDGKGIKIPFTSKFIERILLATGTLPEETNKLMLLKMAEYINKDEFWLAQIEQIQIQPNGELLMVPQIGDYLIQFGLPEDYQRKLRNLKAVYTEGFKNLGWNKYQMISVKYQNQVVCTKK